MTTHSGSGGPRADPLLLKCKTICYDHRGREGREGGEKEVMKYGREGREGGAKGGGGLYDIPHGVAGF